MAQAGYTPISLYYSTTAAAVPTAGNLVAGELAINITDGKLYYENNSGVVTLLASATTVTNSFSAGTTGFTPSTATTGAVTLGGTLITSNGGTGLASYTAGDLSYYASGTALTKLAIGTAGQFLTSTGTAPQWSTLSGVAVTTFSAGTTGFTPSSATSGAVTLAGTLATTNGGTGLTSFTSGGVVYASSTSALATGSALTFDGTNILTTGSILLGGVSSTGTAGEIGLGNSKAIRFRNAANSAFLNAMYVDASNNLQLGAGTSDAIISVTNVGEAMRIVSTTGNVGIGTSSPAYKLDVTTATAGFATILTNTNGASDSNGLYVRAGTVSSEYNLRLSNTAGSTDFMVVKGNGNVGIGTVSPAGKLDITSASGGYANIYLTQTGVKTWAIENTATSGLFKIIEAGVSDRLILDGVGNAALSGTTIPPNTVYPGLFLAYTTNIIPVGGAGSLCYNVYTVGTQLKWQQGGFGGSQFVFGNGEFVWSGNNTGGTVNTNATLTEFMRLNASGNLGIGTSSPTAAQLVIKGDGATSQIRAQAATNTNQGLSFIYNYSSQFGQINCDEAGVNQLDLWYTALNHKFGRNTSSATMTLDASGYLMVGATTSNSARLTIANAGAEVFQFYPGVASNENQTLHYNRSTAVYCTNSVYAADHRFFIGGNEKARIDSSGNLGIGTASPGNLLSVLSASTTATVAKFAATNYGNLGTTYIEIGTQNGDGGSRIGSINPTGNQSILVFETMTATSGTYAERARIDNNGNLFVGTSSTSVTNGGFTFEPNYNGTGISAAFFGHSSGGGNGNQYCIFTYNGTTIGSIAQSGTTAVLYNVTSDQRLKENIVDADSASALIDSLQVRQYNWKSDGSHQRYGFVAQELVTVAPEAVNQPTDTEEMMGVDYSKLVPMLVKEIQSLRKRLADAGI